MGKGMEKTKWWGKRECVRETRYCMGRLCCLSTCGDAAVPVCPRARCLLGGQRLFGGLRNRGQSIGRETTRALCWWPGGRWRDRMQLARGSNRETASPFV